MRYEIHAVAGVLQIGKINGDLGVAIQSILLDGSNQYGDDDRLLGIKPQVFSDGITIWPEALRKVFVDDRHLLASGGIVVREEPAFQQWNLHGSEVVRAGAAYVRLQFL